MYESHFGLSASPFQLNPDPGFYFDSKGHSRALAYLRYGAHQGEGFIVVTGEIGAGKTTLVRTLMAELDSRQSVVAQIVSTQLEAGELLRSILAAFGVPSASTSKAALISSLEAFLTLLATRNQRALLIVDEAQNLNLQAVEELRMLSNFQFDRHALLQSFLVGQPDLRQLLQSQSLEQLRQRVIASCHLGPMDAAETAAYVQHRLRHVGWQERPRFDPQALEVVHRLSGGIPRRINLLCNRLMLGAYFDGSEDITPVSVENVAAELRAEIGEPARPAPAKGACVREVPLGTDVVRHHRTPGVALREPLVYLTETPMQLLAARALSTCLRQGGMPVDLVCITPCGSFEFDGDDGADSPLGATAMEVHLRVPASETAAFIAEVLLRVDALLDELRPRAVIVDGSGNGALACSLAAHKRGLPVLHFGGGLRTDPPEPGAVNAALIDRLASFIVTDRVSARSTLAREGIPAERVHCLGNLAANAAQVLRDGAPSATAIARKYGADHGITEDALGFGVMTLRMQHGSAGVALTEFLRGLDATTPPIVWLVDAATDDALRSARLAPMLQAARVTLLPCLSPREAVALLSESSWLLCDAARDLAETAEALDLPCLRFASAARTLAVIRTLATEGQPAPPAAPWDGGPGMRIAQQLGTWLSWTASRAPLDIAP